MPRILTLIAFSLLSIRAAFPQEVSREPIRVGGNVQASKLVYQVDPVYPPRAREARVSGMVILQVTIDAKGEVSKVQVLRGHPLLDDAALEAVRQWRYSPTYLNGEAVPVIATVSVVFNADGSPNMSLVVDQQGLLRDPRSQLQGDAVLDRVRETRATVVVTVDPRAPLRVAEETLRALEKAGASRVEVQGSYAFRAGRLFYIADSQMMMKMVEVDRNSNRFVTIAGPEAPELALDRELLAALARGETRAANLPGRASVTYRLFVSEVGEILSVEPLSGPRSAAVEAELARTRVVTPGRLRGDPVPTAVTVEIPIE